MGKRKVVKAYVLYQEKMINFSDIDHKEITNNRAKEILGLSFRIPRFCQAFVINEMIEMNLLKRKTQDILVIKSNGQ